MVQVCYSVALSVAYLPFDQAEGNTKLLRSLASSIVRTASSLIPDLSSYDIIVSCHNHSLSISVIM